jgi:excinuclease UvrABC ATPase subunit
MLKQDILSITGTEYIFIQLSKRKLPNCKGLGTIKKINTDYFIDNPKLSINQGGLLPLEDIKSNKWILAQIKNILEIFGLGMTTHYRIFRKKLWIIFITDVTKNSIKI